ncbi:MAG: hypothetical protein ACXVC6_00465 [Bacteroidia bacterium]
MKKNGIILLIAMVVMMISCKKKSSSAPVDPRVPPKLEFKTGATYVYKDTTVTKQDTLMFGIVATKTEDNLSTLNGSSSFDGNTSTSSFYNHHMATYEYSGFSIDLPYYVRNQAGTEKVIFTVVDRDGNITKISVTLTVI